MIFFNFWVGPEGDLGMVGAWLGGGWGVVPPMVPPRGESIEFDTLIIFPLVLQVKKFQNLGKSMSKFGLQGVPPPTPSLLSALAGRYCRSPQIPTISIQKCRSEYHLISVHPSWTERD